jgi:phenylpropionate dioxygenase-like ring-hydroxylating dioxygenase large terminal subunit
VVPDVTVSAGGVQGFLRDAWYVAAWESELGEAPLAVRVLGEDIVLYRRADGGAVALEDACPHRKLPLSMGRVRGDHIECGYHGLTFDCSGACVRVPGGGRIPTGARVRAYPLASRYGLLWIWMGDPAGAEPAGICEVDHWGDPAWGVNQGDSMTIACNQLFLTDNLLDPSHVAWVHPGSFGNAAAQDTPLQVDVREDRVVVSRWMRDVEAAPFYAPHLGFAGRVDRKQHYEVRLPGHALARAIFAPAGTGGDDGRVPAGTFLMDSWNFLTPVDASTTRYFWFQLRNVAPDDEALSRRFAESVRAAFEEDRRVLEAVQRGMDAARTPPINLPIDSGPLRYRRLLAERVAAERGRVSGADAGR